MDEYIHQGPTSTYIKGFENLRFECLGSFAPEQYDVYKDDKHLAYVRLRHGRLTCEMNDDVIYSFAWDSDNDKPCFADQYERIKYLRIIAIAITNKLQEQK